MPSATSKNIHLTTEDKVKLTATYYETVSEKGVLLLHMLGNNRHSWDEFAIFIQSNGYQALAVDLRGHGQSLEKNGKRISYINFTEQDFQDMTHDIAAAKKFLERQGASDISIIGASIGANLALIYAVHDRDIKKIILLSPGLNYKGLKTQESAKKLATPTLIVAADDDQYAAMSSRTLDGVMHTTRELKILPKADHGTRMFSHIPELKSMVVNFLEKIP